MYPGACFVCGSLELCKHREPEIIRAHRDRVMSMLWLDQMTSERKPPRAETSVQRETEESTG